MNPHEVQRNSGMIFEALSINSFISFNKLEPRHIRINAIHKTITKNEQRFFYAIQSIFNQKARNITGSGYSATIRDTSLTRSNNGSARSLIVKTRTFSSLLEDLDHRLEAKMKRRKCG